MRLFSYAHEPFNSLLRLQEELDRVFERPLGRWESSPSARGVFPPVNVFNQPDRCVIRVEVPGLSPENTSLEAQGNTLMISGKRKLEEETKGSVHRRERWSGEFSRSLQIPKDFDLSRSEASYRHGILNIEVPKREEAKPRQITVRAS